MTTGEYGVGIGWRPEIAGFVAGLPGLRFAEVVAESVHAHGDLPAGLGELRDRGVAVDPARREAVAGRRRAGRAGPRRAPGRGRPSGSGAPLVSEHIAFVRAGGVEAGHLLPIPRSREAVDAMVGQRPAHPGRAGRADRAGADRGAVRLAGRRAGRGRVPHRDPRPDRRAAAAGRRQRLRQRAATAAPTRWRCSTGCRWSGSRTCTWRAAPSTTGSTTTRTPTRCRRPVLDLVAELCARHRPPALMLERDGDYPPAAALRDELDAIAKASGYPAVT